MATAITNDLSPEREAYDHELRVVLERAIDYLPDNYGSVFVLRVVEGLDVAETAEALDLGSQAVKTRLPRARALLRRDLRRRAGIEGAQAFPFHATRCDRVVAEVFLRIGDSLGLATRSRLPKGPRPPGRRFVERALMSTQNPASRPSR